MCDHQVVETQFTIPIQYLLCQEHYTTSPLSYLGMGAGTHEIL